MIAYLELLDTPQEKTAFQTLYEMYAKKMYLAAVRIVDDSAAAEDMVHETFLSLMGHLDKLSDAGSRQTWNYVLTALKHHCFNWMKKQDRMVSYCREDDIWAVEEKGLEEECIGQEQKEVLAALIGQLRYPYKEVLYLQYFNEMKSREIADVLKLRPDHVRQVSRRAKKQLKKKMEEMGYLS